MPISEIIAGRLSYLSVSEGASVGSTTGGMSRLSQNSVCFCMIHSLEVQFVVVQVSEVNAQAPVYALLQR
jgi:hypothetical protein